MLTLKDYWGLVYDILVADGGAYESERSMFLDYATTGQPMEWRFQGYFSFGGKLYFRSANHPPRADCYPEDETPLRLVRLKEINAKLAALGGPYGKGGS